MKPWFVWEESTVNSCSELKLVIPKAFIVCNRNWKLKVWWWVIKMSFKVFNPPKVFSPPKVGG